MARVKTWELSKSSNWITFSLLTSLEVSLLPSQLKKPTTTQHLGGRGSQSEFEAHLAYKVISRTAKATQRYLS